MNTTLHTRIIFFNIGWMKTYDGPSPDGSVQIHAGSSFIKEHGFGYEMYNFQSCMGRAYGYVQPVKGKKALEGTIRIDKLGTGRDATHINNVLVVFLARSPISKVHRIVGWYNDATVYRHIQKPPKHSNRSYNRRPIGYYATTASDKMTLLKETEREIVGIKVPVARKGEKGGLGQSHVWYAQDERDKPFVKEVTAFIIRHSDNAEYLDTKYQAATERAKRKTVPDGPVPKSSHESTTSRQWSRDPGHAKEALVRSGFQCELDKRHRSFISPTTGKNFVEAHHLLPMSQQGHYEDGLDFPENIIALCPNCHRKIHFASPSIKKSTVKKLFIQRQQHYAERGITIDLHTLLQAYGVK